MTLQKEIQKAVEVLEKGGVILYPTDTLWGLGCNATNAEAVDKIYQLKGRPATKGLIILIADINELKKYVEQIPDKALEIMKQTDKPITIVYEKARHIAQNATAPDGSVAIRIPKNDFCQQLIRKLGHPITSTSANTSGIEPPTNFKQVETAIIKGVDYVVNWRQNETGTTKSSSIYKITANGELVVIRE